MRILSTHLKWKLRRQPDFPHLILSMFYDVVDEGNLHYIVMELIEVSP